MKTFITIDRPAFLVGTLAESNESTTQLPDRLMFIQNTTNAPSQSENATTDSSFQDYFNNEWRKHFVSSKPSIRRRNRKSLSNNQ